MTLNSDTHQANLRLRRPTPGRSASNSSHDGSLGRPALHVCHGRRTRLPAGTGWLSSSTTRGIRRAMPPLRPLPERLPKGLLRRFLTLRRPSDWTCSGEVYDGLVPDFRLDRRARGPTIHPAPASSDTLSQIPGSEDARGSASSLPHPNETHVGTGVGFPIGPPRGPSGPVGCRRPGAPSDCRN